MLIISLLVHGCEISGWRQASVDFDWKSPRAGGANLEPSEQDAVSESEDHAYLQRDQVKT